MRNATCFAAAGGRLWVGELGGRIVASVGLTPGGDGTVQLKKLYVDPTVRRLGIGERMVSLVEREASDRGTARIELWSDTRFEDAHRLYERLGYERLGETRELGDRSETVEYRFAKPLP